MKSSKELNRRQQYGLHAAFVQYLPFRGSGGADRARTDDLLHAMQALFQLSYGPTRRKVKHIRSGICVQSKNEVRRKLRRPDRAAMVSVTSEDA